MKSAHKTVTRDPTRTRTATTTAISAILRDLTFAMDDEETPTKGGAGRALDEGVTNVMKTFVDETVKKGDLLFQIF